MIDGSKDPKLGAGSTIRTRPVAGFEPLPIVVLG
jgi:hypothetical protein